MGVSEVMLLLGITFATSVISLGLTIGLIAAGWVRNGNGKTNAK